ncbi:MAG: bifunctional oligoribonuclease/PAP phosphatase NrnA [Spirochaetaceae bacterium]|jgi:phosphoesterase RecJ-like protein|nr:bifunctional oligoribonuclease/PAP phosphatase NrnA [Spirochaetaceae bacterium]
MWQPFPPPRELVDFIRNGSKFIIAGHKEPDADCIGSQLALASALRRLGKDVVLCSAGPFKRTEVQPYKALFLPELDDAARCGASVIVIDCSMEERTGTLAPSLRGLPTALIDHHASGTPYGTVRYLDSAAPSTTALVFALITSLGLSPTTEEAEFLFFGLAADTGFFRHVDDGGERVYALASELIHYGANPKKTFAQMNGGKTLNSRLLMANVLSRAKSYLGGRLIISTEELEETERFGLESRDSDMLYQLIQSIEGVEAIALIRQESPEKCSVGLRSRDTIDVSQVAACFGGGGHKNAAGFLIEAGIAGLLPRILAEFEKIMG